MVSRRRTVTIELLVDDDDKRKLDGVGDAAERTGSKFTQSFGGVAKLAAGAFAVDQLKDFAGEMITLAGTAEATSRKVSTVFGENADDIEDWADDVNEAFGTSTTNVEGMAAAIGDLLVPMGFTREEAAQLSPVIAEAANAFAEFQPDVTTEQAINAVTSALTGEREALKGLGIVIKEEDLKAEGLTGTFQGLTGETDQQRKALDTLNLIFAQGSDALEAYEDRAGTLQAQQKELTARWEEAKNQLAQSLLPVLVEATSDIAEATSGWEGFGNQIEDSSDRLSGPVGDIINRTKALVEATRNTISPQEESAQAAIKLTAAHVNAARANFEAAMATAEYSAEVEVVDERMKSLAVEIPKLIAKYEDQAETARDAAAAHHENLIPAISDTIDIFEEASEEIGPSLADVEQNLDDHVNQQENFWTVVQSLYDAGMPELAERIREGGPEMAAAGQEALDDLGRAMDIEERLAGLGNTWAAFMEGEARAMANESGPTVFGILEGYGIDMSKAVERGFLNGMAGINWDQYFRGIATGVIPNPPGLVGGGGSDAVRNGGPVPQ